VAHVLGRIAPAASLHPAQVNGHPALIIRLDGEIDTVIAVRIDDGRIAALYAVRNPRSCRAWTGRPPCAAESGASSSLFSRACHGSFGSSVGQWR